MGNGEVFKSPKPSALILSVSHGAGHRRAADALEKALREVEPLIVSEVVDGLLHCAPWFRRYYSSYEVFLRRTPHLWGWIDSIQHRLPMTGPRWLYRRGGKPLFRFLQERNPDIVIATEVGMCELAALSKRDVRARFLLAGVCLMDVDRAWAQPEVDLYAIASGDLARQLQRAGVPPSKIVPCGTPIDPSFATPRDRTAVRRRLHIDLELPMLLVLFGGTGFGRPQQILAQIDKVRTPLEVVLITGRNQRLEEQVRSLCRARPRTRVLGWVDNIQEWMTAADLLVTKPAGMTIFEAFACGLPLLAFDPLPGNEIRNCDLIEKWKVGYWVRNPKDLGPAIERLLADRNELSCLRERARALAQPRAAHHAAAAILELLKPRADLQFSPAIRS